MSRKLTRRAWSASLATAAAGPLVAQTKPNDSPAELLVAARRINENHRKALAGFKIARSVEPAFQFKA